MLAKLRSLPPLASAGPPSSPTKPKKAQAPKKKCKNLIKLEQGSRRRTIQFTTCPSLPSTHVPVQCVIITHSIFVFQKTNPDYGQQSINPISRLIQIQQAKKEKDPVYTMVAEKGVPRRREFIMQVGIKPDGTTGGRAASPKFRSHWLPLRFGWSVRGASGLDRPFISKARINASLSLPYYI